jgi:hypothetical protein
MCILRQARRLLVPCFSISHSPGPQSRRPVLSTSRCTGLGITVRPRPRHLQGLGSTVSRSVAERHPGAAVIVPSRSGAVPSKTAETAPPKRDQHLQLIAEHGRMGWQKASGYTRRALAEATIGRFKRVISGGLHSRTDQRRATEMTVAVAVLSRMLELGRPKSVRMPEHR